MLSPAVVVDVREGAMWIRLNRPEAMNSLTPEVLSGIDQALNDAEENQDVRAVVLTGTGRAFCAGADLKYVRSQSGSVAMTTSAPVCLACSIAAAKTFGFSGFETCPGTLGKSPLGSLCGP